MNKEQINRDLIEKASSPFQDKVVTKLREHLKLSSDSMGKYWNGWEEADKLYRGYVIPDKDDKAASAKKEPTKIAVPVSYAQVQTAVSFIFSALQNREYLWELKAIGAEDVKPALMLERDLNYQVSHNSLLLSLYGWLLDGFKVGFGVVRNEWREDYARMRVGRQEPIMSVSSLFNMFSGQPTKTKLVETVEEVLKYQGNCTKNVSPYNFLPDPNVPLAKFQQGVFVGHEEETNRASVCNEEGKLYHGTKHIPDHISKEILNTRKRFAGKSMYSSESHALRTRDKASDLIVLSEIVISIVPADWSEEFDMDFGDETTTTKFIAVLANDQKLIRFEPLGYLHDEYPYSLFEYSPDHNSFYNHGLIGTISEMQTMINWFLNSHVTAVRKVLQSRLLVNPEAVNIDDLTGDKAFIRLKTSGFRNIDNAIKQLDVRDVTQNHVNDIDMLNTLVQLITGVNENALGQFSNGRRSATEAKNVNAGAAARLKMHAVLFWEQGLKPLGMQYIANTRQGRTKEVYDQIIGKESMVYPYEQVILTDPMKLAGGYDFMPFDATLPSDKMRYSELLSKLFEMLISNGDAASAFGLNPKTLMNHILALNGMQNLNAVFESEEKLMAGLGANPQAQVVPDDQIAQLQEQGAQPIDLSGLPR